MGEPQIWKGSQLRIFNALHWLCCRYFICGSSSKCCEPAGLCLCFYGVRVICSWTKPWSGCWLSGRLTSICVISGMAFQRTAAGVLPWWGFQGVDPVCAAFPVQIVRVHFLQWWTDPLPVMRVYLFDFSCHAPAAWRQNNDLLAAGSRSTWVVKCIIKQLDMLFLVAVPTVIRARCPRLVSQDGYVQFRKYQQLPIRETVSLLT